jgi:hypothetical protein
MRAWTSFSFTPLLTPLFLGFLLALGSGCARLIGPKTSGSSLAVTSSAATIASVSPAFAWAQTSSAPFASQSYGLFPEMGGHANTQAVYFPGSGEVGFFSVAGMLSLKPLFGEGVEGLGGYLFHSLSGGLVGSGLGGGGKLPLRPYDVRGELELFKGAVVGSDGALYLVLVSVSNAFFEPSARVGIVQLDRATGALSYNAFTEVAPDRTLPLSDFDSDFPPPVYDSENEELHFLLTDSEATGEVVSFSLASKTFGSRRSLAPLTSGLSDPQFHGLASAPGGQLLVSGSALQGDGQRKVPFLLKGDPHLPGVPGWIQSLPATTQELLSDSVLPVTAGPSGSPVFLSVPDGDVSHVYARHSATGSHFWLRDIDVDGGSLMDRVTGIALVTSAGTISRVIVGGYLGDGTNENSFLGSLDPVNGEPTHCSGGGCAGSLFDASGLVNLGNGGGRILKIPLLLRYDEAGDALMFASFVEEPIHDSLEVQYRRLNGKGVSTLTPAASSVTLPFQTGIYSGARRGGFLAGVPLMVDTPSGDWIVGEVESIEATGAMRLWTRRLSSAFGSADPAFGTAGNLDLFQHTGGACTWKPFGSFVLGAGSWKAFVSESGRLYFVCASDPGSGQPSRIRLLAVDAATGVPVASFGTAGLLTLELETLFPQTHELRVPHHRSDLELGNFFERPGGSGEIVLSFPAKSTDLNGSSQPVAQGLITLRISSAGVLVGSSRVVLPQDSGALSLDSSVESVFQLVRSPGENSALFLLATQEVSPGTFSSLLTRYSLEGSAEAWSGVAGGATFILQTAGTSIASGAAPGHLQDLLVARELGSDVLEMRKLLGSGVWDSSFGAGGGVSFSATASEFGFLLNGVIGGAEGFFQVLAFGGGQDGLSWRNLNSNLGTAGGQSGSLDLHSALSLPAQASLGSFRVAQPSSRNPRERLLWTFEREGFGMTGPGAFLLLRY